MRWECDVEPCVGGGPVGGGDGNMWSSEFAPTETTSTPAMRLKMYGRVHHLFFLVAIYRAVELIGRDWLLLTIGWPQPKAGSHLRGIHLP